MFVVRTLRLPRVLSAVLIGMCLAMSGAIFQGLARNPLVSPDIIGIDAGARRWWRWSGSSAGGPYSLLPVGAFIGAVTAAAVIYGLSWKRGVSASRLILVGIGVGEVISAFSTYVTLEVPDRGRASGDCLDDGVDLRQHLARRADPAGLPADRDADRRVA
jgi:iron complex transport system permease protein